MSRNRIQTWRLRFIATVFALPMAALALVACTVVTEPLHPEPDSVPSITRSSPSEEWADAAARGRQVMHGALIDQNLPGLSVAVGVAGDVVWAEGFGWANLEKRVPVAPEMRFRIGTASMALTSAAVGLLLESDRMGLDE